MLKNKYFAIAISIVAIIFVLRTVFILKKKKYPQFQKQPQIVMNQNTQSISPLPSQPQDTKSGLENTITSETLYEPVKIEEVKIPEVSSLEWGEDPFYKESSKIEIKNENGKYLMVSLEGIVFSGGKKKAIINGKILEEGESYGGVYIKKINDESIVIFFNGKEQKIKMFEKVSIPIKSEIGGEDEK